jgi:hypothetical protein
MTKKKTEVQQVQPAEIVLVDSLNDVITNSGLEFSKAQKYAMGYAPLMSEVIAQSELLKPLDKTNPEDAAKAKRISLDLGKICSMLTAKKKEDKDTLLIETRLIDGLFNVAESTARLTQKDADEICEYLEVIEHKRRMELADTRRAELQQYDVDTTYLPLEIMGDEQYARCLEDGKLAFDARRERAERIEAERLEQIRLAGLAEQERLRLQAERIEAERPEAERLKFELAEKEALLVKEREASKAEADKLAAENAKKLAEQKRIADEAAKKQAAELAKQKAEADKLAKELQAKKDSETKAEADKKAAQLAPDKEKINQLYKSLKAFEVPDFTTTECAVIGTEVLNKISHILSYIKAESIKLK